MPIFFFSEIVPMRYAENNLTRLAKSVVEPMGYELVGVEYFQRGNRGAVLRVYIDHKTDQESGAVINDFGTHESGTKGITLDDCSAVSQQLSGVLDVEDPISGHYYLEVSSPGLDRPLFTAEHYQRFRGRRARVRLADKVDGRRNVQGQILGVVDGAVRLLVDGETIEVSLAAVQSAHLVPDEGVGNRR